AEPGGGLPLPGRSGGRSCGTVMDSIPILTPDRAGERIRRMGLQEGQGMARLKVLRPRRNQGRTGAKVTGADAAERRATMRSIASPTPPLAAIALTPRLAAAQPDELRVLDGGGGP